MQPITLRPYTFETFNHQLRNPISQVALGVLLSAASCIILPPLQATGIGFGVTAILVAIREYRDVAIIHQTPIPVPTFKFNLASFDQIDEPWKATLKFCKISICIGGGVCLLTNMPYITLTLLCAAVAAKMLINDKQEKHLMTLFLPVRDLASHKGLFTR